MTPLHQLGQFFREWLQSIPMFAVRSLFVGSLVLILIWLLRLPKQAVTPATGAQRWDENLKPIAATAILLQILIYLFL